MELRRIATPLLALALLGTSAAPASAATLGSVSFRPAGADPLADVAAAARVRESRWEPRRGNAEENQRRPSDDQIEDFRRRSVMLNRDEVTGRYRGTTDEIIQWAAHKWGFDPDLFRAVAYVESRWRMSAVGDGGLSFGLFQMKRTYHCCVPLSSRYTAFNADYYGGILRSYFDGRERWLNDEERGERYTAGDLWGSVGAWYAGRWRTAAANGYIRDVQRVVRNEPWRDGDF
jgi:hypothetical protein